MELFIQNMPFLLFDSLKWLCVKILKRNHASHLYYHWHWLCAFSWKKEPGVNMFSTRDVFSFNEVIILLCVTYSTTSIDHRPGRTINLTCNRFERLNLNIQWCLLLYFKTHRFSDHSKDKWLSIWIVTGHWSKSILLKGQKLESLRPAQELASCFDNLWLDTPLRL